MDSSGDADIVEKAFQDPQRNSDEGEEVEEDLCRICRTSGEKGSPLFYPCACSGSIKYVHQDCLLQWLSHSNARDCEVCKHPFTFSPVYAENAPIRLSYREFGLGLIAKVGRGLQFFWRLAFVTSVWLIFVPLITFWIWRLTFVKSISEAQKLVLSRLMPTLLVMDCLHGFLLSAGIVFIFLGATSLREYFRHLRELGNLDRDDDVLVVDRQPGARERMRQVQGHLGDRVEGGAQVEPPGGWNREGGGLRQGFATGAGQLILRNAENVAARIEMQAARLEAHVEQMFEAPDDGDGGDVPFDELIGMQGPVFQLVENAITMLVSNAIFLGLVVILPFILGRLVLFLASRLMVMRTFGVKLANTVVSVLNNNMILTGLVNDQAYVSEDSTIGNTTLAKTLIVNGIENMSKAVESPSLNFSDATIVAAGYGVIFIAGCLYLGLRALINYSKGEPVIAGRLQGVASVAGAAPSVARQGIAGLKYLMTLFKVTFVLLVELGVFPLLCGCWLDICSLSILGGTMAKRLAFFWASPLTSCLLHWLVGIVYMLHISIFVSLLREVLRPGVLYFLRDPADPNYNPFHDLVEDPIHKQARRVMLSVVVYGSLVVMLLFLPVKLAVFAAPSLFPLDIRISDPFTEIAADMLLFHICIPFAIEHFRPKATIKTVLFYWFSAIGWVLNLSEFLLPGSEDANDVIRGALAQEPVPQDPNWVQAPAVVDSVNGSSNIPDADDQSDSDEYMFAFRILLLLIGAWVTLLLFNSTMMLLPVSLGRAIFSALSHFPITYGVKCNDLYAFNIGCYVIWATVTGIGYVVEYLKTHNVQILLIQALKWTAIVTKSSLLLSLWVVVIPVLIGLLFELLVVIPLRVPIDESPVFLLYQDWALGLVFLKIWTRLVMLGQVAPLVDESWRRKFEQVKADGFVRLRGLWVMREIVGPVLVQLLTALSVPYVLARGLFPTLGYSLIVNSAVYRFAWSGSLMLGMLWYGGKCLKQWLSELHNTIRDDRYLIGKRLHNYYKDRKAEKSSSPSVSTLPVESGSEESLKAASVLNSLRQAEVSEILEESSQVINEFEEMNRASGLSRRHGPSQTASSTKE